MKIAELLNLILNDKKIQEPLEELKNYHKETYEHSLRVGLICIKLGLKNNLSIEEIKLLGISGLLHDLGKLDIPKDILNKNSSLNEKERKIIEGHSEKGFERLKNFKEIKEIVEHHHKHQKKSYPHETNGIKKELCEIAQIIAVVDMFDALSNKRVYKEK
ncbi:MAG: HD domain-containing phosphohydrolase, partial [Nanoarchaeota archaeon]